jgi:hypothetical protein
MKLATLSIVLIAVLGFAVRWVQVRKRLRLADALHVPWYLWPLNRFVIHLWKLEAHKDLFKVCGWWTRSEGMDVPTRRAWRYIEIGRYDWRGAIQVLLHGARRSHGHAEAGKFWVKIKVAPGFNQGDEETDRVINAKQLVVNQARGTLDLGPVDAHWDFRFMRRHVILTPKEVVPKVALGMTPDIAAVVAANLTPTTVVPAIGKGDKPVIHDANDDAPHVLISGTTNGGGKTETLKTFGIQYYSTGSDLLIVDTIRQFSHVGWAIDPATQQPWPGITYADTIEEAALWIVRAGRVMEQRGTITKQAMKRGEIVEWPRLVMLLDDMNGVQAELKRHGFAEALHYLSLLLWVSRGVGMCIIAAFQRGSAHAAGGGDNREAYGLRIWADGSGKTGDMLADQVDKAKRPKPKPHSVQPGHSVFIYSSLAFEAQRIYYTDDEARAICAAEARRRGRPAIEAVSWRTGEGENPSGVPEGPGSGPESQTPPNNTLRPQTLLPLARSGFSPSPDAQSSMQEMGVISHIDEADGEVNYLTLRDIARQEWCPFKYHTIRSYARDAVEYDFPDPIEGFSNPRRWSERDVRDWLETRQGNLGNPGVYVIEPPGSATVKIGETKRLEGRLDELSLSGLGDQVVIQWLPCRTKKHAQELEDWLHAKYDTYRVSPKAEWFHKQGRLAEDYQVRGRLLAGCPAEIRPLEEVRS